VNDHLFEYSRSEVLMYLRHETGHALNYAFELWRRKDWIQTFGDFRRPYRDVYNPNPWSRDYVRYLHRAGMYHYAQKHPDEDWAESFAVWLDPASRWRRRYRDWQVAFAKLEYVDRIVERGGACKGTPAERAAGAAAARTPRSRRRSPSTSTSTTPSIPTWPSTAATCWRSSPAAARAPAAAPPAMGKTQNAQSAARFIQQHQRLLVNKLSGWIGNSDRRVIEKFLRQLQAPVHLRAPGGARQPPQREAGRPHHRGHLARGRRHPPVER
jgi:hypothetical protein